MKELFLFIAGMAAHTVMTTFSFSFSFSTAVFAACVVVACLVTAFGHTFDA